MAGNTCMLRRMNPGRFANALPRIFSNSPWMRAAPAGKPGLCLESYCAVHSPGPLAQTTPTIRHSRPGDLCLCTVSPATVN